MANKIERKCPNCGTWNTDVDHCTNCNTLINLALIEEKVWEERKEEEEKNKDKIDLFIEKYKKHPNILLRAMFYSVYSVWLIVMGIGSFLAYLIAWTAG